MSDRVVAVAVPLPFQTPFSYRVPEGWTVPAIGCRVGVRFGGRRVVGVVAGPGEAPAGVDLKDLDAVLDAEPVVPAPLLELARRVSEHYLAPLGECFRLVMPPAGMGSSRAVARLLRPDVAAGDGVTDALRGGPLPVSALETRLGRDPRARLARLQRDGIVEIEQRLAKADFETAQVAVLVDPRAEAKGTAQREVLARLCAAGGRARVADLVRDRPSLRGAVDRLGEKGVLAIEEERLVRSPDLLPGTAALAPDPSADQAAAIGVVTAAIEAGGYAAYLLHGITGSGKTEVYFRAAERALAAGRGVILLVPEIALTPVLVRAAVARFGATVSVLHSEMTPGERLDQWWRIREGGARVVVGARSAVFAPLADLGLVVVDEEHEGSYKQEESPRYHGRDVAVLRASLTPAVALLGSATPSVESHQNAEKGKYQRLGLPSRIGAWGLPRVEIVDRREILKQKGDPILTPVLLHALQARVERKEQALLLLNRRGYATSLLCRECGAQAACPNCSVALTLHDGGRRALCHYCAHEVWTPEACPGCQGAYLRLQGFGTEKVVERVREALPGARVERLDRDLAQRKGVLHKVLHAFERGEIDVLVGTQMIAKGHDFPRVTLVGVIDADVGLGMPDFRAAERTFQLLTQVAGRAGRADLAGEVVLQSHWPSHYALRCACAQDFETFIATELDYRRVVGYPPYGALVNVVVRARELADASREAGALALRLRERSGGRGYRVLGPAAAPLARLRQEHRVQVLLKGDRRMMREAVRAILVERYGSQRWPGVSVDVDPVSVL